MRKLRNGVLIVGGIGFLLNTFRVLTSDWHPPTSLIVVAFLLSAVSLFDAVFE